MVRYKDIKHFINILILIFLTGCSSVPGDIHFNIQGIVVDSKDLTPISDAKVSFFSIGGWWYGDERLQVVKSNEAGEYHIDCFWEGHCGPGFIRVIVEKEGYQSTQSPNDYFRCEESVQKYDFKLRKI